jgi:hypothetical protein|tara:strand:- start:1760 stop:2341 length:582 start_codon:yes stop_codon:yes gene_type:complete
MARLTANGIQFDLADANNSINSYYWMYPANTQKMFWESSAPTGWTQVTDVSVNNKMLRVVTGTGGGISSGILNFTSTLSSVKDIEITVNETRTIVPPGGTPKVIGDHTLTVAQLPEHQHVHTLGPTGGSAATPFSNTGARMIDGSTNSGGVNEGAGGGPHDHPFSGTVNITGTYTAQVNLAVQYVDVIMCKLD